MLNIKLYYSDSKEKLDEGFVNSCQNFLRSIDSLKGRKKPSNVDEYTYMIIAMQSLFTKIDNMKDIKNMFKYILFVHEFLPKFPDNVKSQVRERLYRMKDGEDMDNVLKDLDFLKWQMVAETTSSPKKNHSQRFRRKKQFK